MPSPFADLPRAVQALRRARPFDGEPYIALQTTGNGRSRVTIACMLGGAHMRAGHTICSELSAAPLSFDSRRSQIKNNLFILSALGHGPSLARALAVNPDLNEPAIYPGPPDFASVRELLLDGGLTFQRPLAVFITQTSPTQSKGWRPERFRSAARVLHREYGCEIVFGGTAAEASAIEDLRRGLDLPNISLAGRTTLRQLAALFGLSAVTLTLDTGPLHLARSMRTPGVIIAPAWSPPVEWLPVGNPRYRILKNLDLPFAPDGYVIDEVSAGEVEAALRDLLHAYEPQGPRDCAARLS